MRVLNELKQLANAERAKTSRRYFKTQVGQYGYGDKFLGVNVPSIRKLARVNKLLPTKDIHTLLHSSYHEARMLALIILIYQFNAAQGAGKEAIVRFYLEHRPKVNNWDLVDISAPKILGEYLLDKDSKLLYQLSCSDSLWDRRIAILATLPFIKKHDFFLTFEISKMYLEDSEDLIQKATGWMLREVGKINRKELIAFLDDYAKEMPRVMLRYALEKLPVNLKRKYLKI